MPDTICRDGVYPIVCGARDFLRAIPSVTIVRSVVSPTGATPELRR